MVELPTVTYLRAEHLTPGAIGEVIDEGRIRPVSETGFKNDVFEIGVKIGEVNFAWTMNKKSQRALIAKWGSDTKKWIGKKVKFRIEQRDVFGKVKDVIYADPVV